MLFAVFCVSLDVAAKEDGSDERGNTVPTFKKKPKKKLFTLFLAIDSNLIMSTTRFSIFSFLSSGD